MNRLLLMLLPWESKYRALREARDVHRLRQRQVRAAFAAALPSIFFSVFF
jgi:hypothetical protein